MTRRPDPEKRPSASPPSAASASLLPLARLERVAGAAARRPTCTFVYPDGNKRAGELCKGTPTLASDRRYCPRHDPDTPDVVKQHWARSGGFAATRSAVLPDAPDVALSTPEEVTTLVAQTASEVRRGELAPSVAAAIVGLANVALRAYEANVARRLLDLEKLAADRARRLPAVRLED